MDTPPLELFASRQDTQAAVVPGHVGQRARQYMEEPATDSKGEEQVDDEIAHGEIGVEWAAG